MHVKAAIMEAIYYKVPRPVGQSIRAEYWDLPSFYQPYHYHKECQLTLIISSSGFLYASDGCVPFHKNDIFLLGRNMPHVFRTGSDDSGSCAIPAKAITVFFDHEQFAALFAMLPEAIRMTNLCNSSKYGIKASLMPDSDIIEYMKLVSEGEGISQISDVLKVLSGLSLLDNLEFVSPQSVVIHDPLDGKKIDQVIKFIRQNHRKQIGLEDVAQQINMTPSAFCRFFKKKTNRTFTNYLIDIRVATACKLLTEGDFTVSETCYESGYNSTSNFHRHFRRVTGFSPNEYKRKLLKEGRSI